MKIAITGGMGTGKSTVLQRMRLQLPDYEFSSYDDWVDELYKDREFCENLVIRLGSCERNRVARIVFADAGSMSILFNLVKGRSDEFCASRAQNSVTEVPMLFEGGFDTHFDTKICVSCGPLLQYMRIHGRDGLDNKQIDARLSAQMSYIERRALSDFVIHTDNGQDVDGQIATILEKLGLDGAQG